MDPDVDAKLTILDILRDNMYTKPWFLKIFHYLASELLKPNQEKAESVMNKTLFISGKTGTGKSSFMSIIIKPIFPTSNVELSHDCQPSASVCEKVKVLCSPDNASIDTLYKLTLIPNGEEAIQIKYRETPLTLKYKGVIILSNHSMEKIKEKMEDDYFERFQRRVCEADIGNDKHLAEYLYDQVTELKIPNRLRTYHFWNLILRMMNETPPDAAARFPVISYQKKSLQEFLTTRNVHEAFDKYKTINSKKRVKQA